MSSIKDKSSKLVAFKAMIFWELLNIFLAPVASQFSPGCDTELYLNYGRTYNLTSPNYSNNYPPNTLCRWRYQSPQNSVIRMMCDDINIPMSTNCQTNRLSVSLTGHPTLNDAINYCGQTTLDLTTFGNALSVGLKASNPGRFRCFLSVIPPGGQQPTTETPNNCECGYSQQRRIVGGVETGRNEFVFMAALASRVFQLELRCGSSIISERYAVTAAHCVSTEDADDYLLLVGLHRISEARYENAVLLERFIVHENYIAQNSINDIALIRTASPMQFNAYVGPICLPYRYTQTDFTNAVVTLMGWGSTSFTGPTSDALLAVNMSVISTYNCERSFPNSQISQRNLCTSGYPRDACTYDSGGPVVWFDNFNTFRYQLAGIISWGLDCGRDAPAINTNVMYYIQWILDSSRDAEYCFK